MIKIQNLKENINCIKIDKNKQFIQKKNLAF